MRIICLLLLGFLSACSKDSVLVQLSVTSSAFQNGGTLPEKYTCDGEDVNPPLTIRNVPVHAKSLAVILEDPDVKAGGVAIHWIMFNMSSDRLQIPENTIPIGIPGKNTLGNNGYWGPCPPRGEEHRYVFNVYALDEMLELIGGASQEELKKAMKGHIVAMGKITGKYKRLSP